MQTDSERLIPVHPGEILQEEFIGPMGKSVDDVSTATRIPRSILERILAYDERIDVETALRLGRYFAVSPEFWLGLQMDYDLDVGREQLNDRVMAEVVVLN